ncbi:hypothetical protein PMAYCL1PPCAC_18036, partial [Pristionchus mayeri]
SGAYRHRASSREQRTTTPSTYTSRAMHRFDSISEPLARSEGWTGGKTMKKILIEKEKKRMTEKAQGIHIHSLPRGMRAVSLPPEEEEGVSMSELRRKFNVSLNTSESFLPPIAENTKATEWPPMRSTLPPNGGEFNKQTFLLLSGWLESEKEKRGEANEEWEKRRIPMMRALARARPIVRIDDVADSPLP